ncbi:HEAT repeat-containing protein 6 [Terramyces sp. JEL0728]|nr:HEAT repeat-containing protein 6 [Terramyces sp. JEL0728]
MLMIPSQEQHSKESQSPVEEFQKHQPGAQIKRDKRQIERDFMEETSKLNTNNSHFVRLLLLLDDPSIELMKFTATLVYDRINQIKDQERFINKLISLKSKSRVGRLAIVCLGNCCIGLKDSKLLGKIKLELENEIPVSLKSLILLINENKTIAKDCFSFLGRLLEIIYEKPKNTWESDSESDNEVGKESRQVVYALNCCLALSKQCPKQMQAHWVKFFDYKDKSLLYLITTHPNNHAKVQAIKILISFYEDSQKYLSIASYSSKPTSFTSLQESLANQISSTLRMILYLSNSELLDMLVRNAPIRNLDQDYISEIFNYIQKQPTNHAIIEILGSLAEIIDSGDEEYNNIIKYALDVIKQPGDKNMYVAVLDLIRSLSKSCSELVWKNWSSISPVLFNSLADETLLIVGSLKALEQFCHSANDTVALPYKFWFDLIEKTSTLFHHEFYAIRTITCTIIGQLPMAFIQEMPHRLNAFLLSTIISYTGDDHPEVRAACCGTIGAFVHIPKINNDISILHDFSEKLIILSQDSTLKVRIRACWAIGNLVELKMDFLQDTVVQLFRVSILGTNDHEKVRTHAIRSLGLVALLFDGRLWQQNAHLASQAVDSVLKNIGAGPFKIRWNACHCIKNMLSSAGFPIGSRINYTDLIYKGLNDAAEHSMNFKVKIAAISALKVSNKDSYSTPNQNYTTTIQVIMETLLKSVLSVRLVLEKATYEDQKYVKQFLGAVRDCIDHFKIILMDDYGFSALENEIQSKIDSIINK